MNLSEFLKNSSGVPPISNLVIVGVNPIIEELTSNPQVFSDILACNEDVKITVIHEGDTENFNQSLFYDREKSRNKMEYDKLQTYKKRLLGGSKGKNKISGFVEDVLTNFKKATNANSDKVEAAKNRIKIFQNNLRHTVNLIYIDDIIWCSETLLDLPTLEMYRKITAENDADSYDRYKNYIEFLLNVNNKNEIEGNIFLSTEGEELIQLYDNQNYPRLIAPRKAFYSTDFQRYSIWAFIFNRKGELLLHKRSDTTKDNRSLWDKSAGGHVDLTDSSTMLTAKRELVEEMFLPNAEYTKYMQAKLGDIIDFGEWNTEKREEKHFIDSFNALDADDWIVFRATDTDAMPMTIRRKSPRIMHIEDRDENGKKVPLRDKDGNIIFNANRKPKYQEHTEIWYTRFISDVFLFIAPEGLIDNMEQMHDLIKTAEKAGAASAHKLVSIDSLIEDIEDSPQLYTDDVVYMCSEKKWLLVEFAEAIKYIFKKT